MVNSSRNPNVISALKNVAEVKRMSPRMRLAAVNEARKDGAEWEAVYENIRSIVDPMDVMTDTQVFGAEVPIELWRE